MFPVQGGQEAIQQRSLGRPLPSGQEERPAASAQPLGQHPDRLVPTDRFESAGPGPQWAGEAIRIVEPLQRRHATRAQTAARNRMIRVALDHDRATLAGPDADATSAGALATGGRIPGRDSRGDLFGRNHIRDQALDLAGGTSGNGRPRTARAEDLQEIPSPETVAHERTDQSPSSDIPCNRGTPRARGDRKRTNPS